MSDLKKLSTSQETKKQLIDIIRLALLFPRASRVESTNKNDVRCRYFFLSQGWCAACFVPESRRHARLVAKKKCKAFKAHKNENTEGH